MEQDTFNVIGVYAPQIGLEEHLKVNFWEDLKGIIQYIPLEEKIFLRGHVGSFLELLRASMRGIGPWR